MKPSPPSAERLQFERATLKRLTDAGATPDELACCISLLVQGRKRPGDDYCTTLNRAAQEKVGIEYVLRCLQGDPPDFIIFRMQPEPKVSPHG